MHFDLVEGARIRARAYKASADGTGFTYFPFLGSKASRNWPVTFRWTPRPWAARPSRSPPRLRSSVWVGTTPIAVR